MRKTMIQGKEGRITTYSFKMFRRIAAVSISETKWHKGEKYKKTPIWFDKVNGKIPTLFIGKVAFLIDKYKY